VVLQELLLRLVPLFFKPVFICEHKQFVCGAAERHVVKWDAKTRGAAVPDLVLRDHGLPQLRARVREH
jgi:hypothetical protein